jgi:hypothetical protein
VKAVGIEQFPLLASKTPRVNFQASSMGFEVANIVARANGRGMVHSCFSRAVNVLFTQNEIVSVVD